MLEGQRSRLVADDFIDALRQIQGLSPHRASLRVTAPASRFGQYLVTGLQRAGYDLRLVSEPVAGVLTHQVSSEDAAGDGSGVYTFLIAVEAVKLKRSYRVDATGIRPASSMFVHGASATDIVLDTARFDTGAAWRSASGQEGSPITRSPGTAADRAAVATADVERPAALRSAPTMIRAIPAAPDAAPSNFYETGESRYAGLLDAYGSISRYVLTFPNDSLYMGPQNKQTVQDIVAAFDPRRDVVSVIGCSHGPTSIDNGNEVLAIGRANRVKEEFVRAGIDPTRVLEEGCWAGKHFEPMPGRGVVVTHQRRAG